MVMKRKMAKFSRDYNNFIICSTLIFFIFSCLLTHANLISLQSPDDNVIKEIAVGVVVDMGSWIGKTIHACISMAISDFYELNSHYKTRIVLHAKNSQGKSIRTLSAVMDLMENNDVHAIIGLETSLEEKFLATLSEKAKIPIFSFSSLVTASSTDYTYLVKIRSDETAQFEGLASVIKSFEWKKVIVLFEGIQGERKHVSLLEESFEGKNIQISYRSFISSISKDNQIIKELRKLTIMETKVYVLDMSLSLASRLLVQAKKLGMINAKNAWIITDKAMNLVHSMDFKVIESLQGTLGFKPNIATSSKIHNIMSRWMTKNPNVVFTELPVVGLWSYDVVVAIAEAFESVNMERSEANFQAYFHGGMLLLDALSRVRFDGLSGEFQLVDGKLFPREFKLVKFLQGNEENIVGIWRSKEASFKEVMCSENIRSNDSNGIICPSGKNTLKGRLLQGLSPKKLRIGVPVKYEFREFVDVYHNNQTNEKNVTGFCIDVFESAVRNLPDPPLYEFIPIWPRAKYDHYIDQVHNQVYDALVGDFTITSNRSHFVDFTLAYSDIGLGMIARLDDDIWFFLRPFSPALWIITMVFFILTALIVWYVEHPINEEFQGTRAGQIGTILFFAVSILVFAHRERLRSNISRFVMGVWLFVVFIIASSYTANLSSILTVKQIKLTKNYYVGYADSLVGELLVTNLIKDHKLNTFASNSPVEYYEALSKGSKKGGVDAIVEEIPYLKVFLARYPDKFQMIGTAKTTNGFAFVFQKGSKLVREMSIAISKLREEGKLLELENKWFRSDSPLLSQDKTDPSTFSAPNNLNFKMFFSLFLFSGISKLVAILLLLIYALYEKLSIKYFVGKLWARRRLISLFRYSFPGNKMTNMIG